MFGALNRLIATSMILGFGLLLLSVPQEAFAQGPQSVAPIAKKLVGAVVNISTTQTLKGPKGIPLPKVPKGSPFEEFFQDFFKNNQKQGVPRRVSSLGSGFVVDPSGLVVTNNHVIADADEIVVNFHDGRKLKVEKVLGRDLKTDLALLKVKTDTPLEYVKFGASAKMDVGDWVMAIGNPFGLDGTVTVGIISAKKRDINSGPYDEFLQTDAAINKGNSGGPLFNMNGEVIGVNTAIISPTGGSIGIGFAVPSATVTHVIDQLKNHGETRRGWLGVRIQTVTDEIADSLGMDKPKGALVASLTKGSPADKSGLEAGDIIIRFAGQDVPNVRKLPRIVARTAIGSTVDVDVLRKGQTRTFRVTIARLDEAVKVAKKPEPSEIPQSAEFKTLGMSIAPLSSALREKFRIDKKVKGVVITDVDPLSTSAAKRLKAGDVIAEVTQEEVSDPRQVMARVDSVKKAGRKTVLFLISDAKGELRFVAVPIKAAKKK